MTGYLADGGVIITVPLQPKPRPRQKYFVPWRQHRPQMQVRFTQIVNHSRTASGAFEEFWQALTSEVHAKGYTEKDHPALVFQKAVTFFAKQAWRANANADLLFHVDTLALLPRPQSHFGTGRNAGQLKANAPWWHAKRGAGDNDNIEKTIWDALSGTLWADDAQVVSNATQRSYTRPGEEACAIIRVLIVSPTDTARMAWADAHRKRHIEDHPPKPF